MRRMNLVILSAMLISPIAVGRQGEPDPASGEPAAEVTEAASDAKSAADIPARMYVNRCTGCHTIGRGALTGPDLISSTGWPAADLRIAVEKMQDKSGPMTSEEIDGLVELLKGPNISSRLAAEEARIALQFAATLAPPSAKLGEHLFDGRETLENGGMACVACHRVGTGEGGLLGPDLSGIFAKTGETGLRSACEKAQFKIMAAAYREHPVTKQEAMHLTAYFEQVGDGPASGVPIERPPFVAAGASLAAVLFLATLFLLKNRHRSVRNSLVRRSS